MDLIEKINEAQRKSGFVKDLLKEKQYLIQEKHELDENLKTLQIKNLELEGKLAGNFNKKAFFLSIAFALILAIAAPSGLMIANAFITTSHEVEISPKE